MNNEALENWQDGYINGYIQKISNQEGMDAVRQIDTVVINQRLGYV